MPLAVDEASRAASAELATAETGTSFDSAGEDGVKSWPELELPGLEPELGLGELGPGL